MLNSEQDRSLRTLLISPDQRIVAQLKDLVAREMPDSCLEVTGRYPDRTVAANLAAARSAQLWFVDVSSDRPAAFRLMAAVAGCAPAVAVVALLSDDDPDLILQCLRQGASEFLISPFTADRLKPALEKLSRLEAAAGLAAPPAESRARIYCVMPGQGASGATTLACHLARFLRRAGLKKVLLADLDGLTGTVPFLLKLKSNFSFVDALTHADNLDADLWKALIVPWNNLDVLLSPEDPVEGIGEDYDPASIVNYSRQAYDAVILDTGGAYGAWNLAAAKLSDEVLVVTTNELPCVHSTRKTLLYLEANGAGRSNLRLIANRYRPDLGLRKEDMESTLGASVFHTLPDDPDAIKSALIEGRTAPSGSAFGRSAAALVERLSGGREQPVKASRWAGLLKRFA
jgi:pilus assembly protein CpaE